MNKSRLLYVEDNIDIANMVKIYFSALGYDVDVAVRGSDALEKTKQVLPHLIVLDIMLPDIDGYEVCRTLQTNTRTSHIPVIFLTQKDERSDKLQGLELGVDDYITKPFDIEELKLRIQGAIRRADRENLTDPRTGLPAGRNVEEQLRRIIREKDWALIDIRINYFESFKDVYGFVIGDDVLRFTAMLIGEVVDEIGTTSDFIGHFGGDDFVIITTVDKAQEVKERIRERFNEGVLTHYNFMDRQQGYMVAPAADGKTSKVPFMTISMGMVSPTKHTFADIREIIELAAERRWLDEQLHRVTPETGWDYLYLYIKYFRAYQREYGLTKSREAIWFTFQIIRELLNELQIVDGFIARTAKNKFLVILPTKLSKLFRKELIIRFDTKIISQYHDIHLKLGCTWTEEEGEKKLPLMKLSAKIVSCQHEIFDDILDITNLADTTSK